MPDLPKKVDDRKRAALTAKLKAQNAFLDAHDRSKRLNEALHEPTRADLERAYPALSGALDSPATAAHGPAVTFTRSGGAA